MKPVVSIIIPTYKPHSYLWSCLDSVYNQTLSKDYYEIIIVLNGCNEPWYSRIKYFISQKQSLKIVLIQEDKSGVSFARNIALDIAKGRFILFMDDDDFVSSSYLEELLACSDENTIGLCYPLQFLDGTNLFRPYYVTKDYYKNYQSDKIQYFRANRYFGGPVYKLIHRDIIGNRRFDLRFCNGEDTLFMFLISDRMKYVSFTSSNAVYYRRIRVGSATQIKKKVSFILKNRFKLMWEFSKIYFSNFGQYNTRFYFLFMIGSMKAIFYNLIHNKFKFIQI